MNIIDIQDQLKNFSEQQLISEMQMPTGSAPQFLVLSEIKRRKRVRDDFMKREAANQPTVAEEAVAAAGVPQSGIMGMSEAMAPKSTMVQNSVGSVMPQSMRPQTMPAPTDDPIPMRSGGLAQFGQELSRKVSEGVEPFLDEVEDMASERFDVDLSSGPMQQQPFMGRIPYATGGIGNLFQDMRGRFPASLRGGKGGAREYSAFNEGGVIKASNSLPLGLRQNNPGNIRPGAGFYGETGQGGGYAEFGSEDEGLRALARLLGTYGDKYGINTLRGLTSRYAPRSDNKLSFDNYLSYLSSTLGLDPDEEFDLKDRRDDLIPAIVGFEQGRDYEGRYSDDQIARAIRAAGTEDEAEIAKILAGSSEPSVLSQLGDAASDVLSAINPISTAQAQSAGPVMTEVEEEEPDTKVRDFEGRVIGDTSLGPSLRENPDPGSYQYDPETGEVIGDTMAKEERRLLNEAINMGRMYEFMYRDRDPDDLGNIGMDSSALGSGAITGSTAGMDPSQIAEVNPPPASTDVNRASASEAPVLQAGSKEDKITFPDQTTTTNVEGDTTTVEGSTIAPTTIVGGESGTYDASGLAAEIKSLQEKLDKDRETDKYLALAQAGLALMSSKDPTLLGAVGEAGVSGLKAYRDAQDRYQEGVIDLINARAKLKGGSGSSFTTNQMIQRAQDLQTMAKEAELSGNSQRARELEMAANSLLIQAGVVDDGDTAISGFADE